MTSVALNNCVSYSDWYCIEANHVLCTSFFYKRSGKVTKWMHDNAPAHRSLATQKKLDYLGFKYLDHPPHSPDLSPSEYYVFPGLKKKIERSPFFYEAEVIAVVGTRLDRQPLNFYFWVACKSYSKGLRSVSSWVGVCWIDPEFGRCSLFHARSD